mgnify:CR=1 FL=1
MRFYTATYTDITKATDPKVTQFLDLANELTKLATWEYVCQYARFFTERFCLRSADVNLASANVSKHMDPWERIVAKLEGWPVSSTGVAEIPMDWQPSLCAYGIGTDRIQGPTKVLLYVQDEHILKPLARDLGRALSVAKLKDEL